MTFLLNSRSLMTASLFAVTTLIVATGGCGQKSVTDPGPQFSMETVDFHINGASTSGILLKRDDAEYSPTIHIDTQKPDSITSVNKVLNCGTFKREIKKSAGDNGMLTFKFNDNEFKDLSKLPSYVACTLAVTITNNIGSIVTKTQPLTFVFDKGPAVDVTRQDAASGFNAAGENGIIPIESYAIRNDFSYPVRIRFAPVKNFDYSPCFIYKAQSLSPGIKLPVTCYRDVTRAKATQLTIEGDYHDLQSENPRALTFTLNSGGWANIMAYFKIDAELAATVGGVKNSLDPSNSYVRTFSGIFISGFNNYAQEPLSLVSTLPVSPLRPAGAPAESLVPLKQAHFSTVSVIGRPEDLMIR